MSRLNDYRDAYIERVITEDSPMATLQRSAFKEGFDTAIELDLAVKFAVWMNGNSEKLADGKSIRSHLFDHNHVTEKQMYDYWIENEYNPEP
jgi:hypothetical protein